MNFVLTQDPIAMWLGEGSESSLLSIVLLRIVLSVALAAIIGYERSTKRHSAGLRTFILVSMACTIAMLLDLYLDRGFCVLSAAARWEAPPQGAWMPVSADPTAPTPRRLQ